MLVHMFLLCQTLLIDVFSSFASFIFPLVLMQAWKLPASIANQDILKCVPAEHLPEVYDLITSGYDDITLRYKLRKFNGRNIFRITPDNTICYVGDLLGSGNRAVRADVSFPHVSKDDSKGDCILSKMIRAFQCMKTAQKKAFCTVPKDLVKPFSYRWFEPDGSLHIEPRLVAYYEVTIREREATRQRNMGGNNCIAVGVASKEFPLEGLMPGWDCKSYAYHSDDGGIFHGTGIKVRYYGPQFGVGDVVGCGIDYATKDVFFTLNGVHLGVAFTGVSGSFYPTVGVDSFCPIKFNFGEAPFKFSLVDYLNTKGYDKKAESFYLGA